MSNSRVFFYRSFRHEKAGRKVSFEKTAFQRAKEEKDMVEKALELYTKVSGNDFVFGVRRFDDAGQYLQLFCC